MRVSQISFSWYCFNPLEVWSIVYIPLIGNACNYYWYKHISNLHIIICIYIHCTYDYACYRYTVYLRLSNQKVNYAKYIHICIKHFLNQIFTSGFINTSGHFDCVWKLTIYDKTEHNNHILFACNACNSANQLLKVY